MILATIAAAGAVRYSRESKEFDRHPLRRLGSGEYMDFSGVLIKSPGREVDRDILRLRVKSVRSAEEESPCGGDLRVAVACPADSPERLRLHAGDKIRISARPSPMSGFRNPGAFSYDSYLKTQRIHRSASTKTRLLVEKLEDGPSHSLIPIFSRIRSSLQRKLEAGFASPDGKRISDEGAILEALLLGEDGRMSPATVRSLQETGLYHLFAISGGHIAIISFLLFSVLRSFRMGRRSSYAVLIGFLVLYTLLVEGSPSVLRATFMTLAFLAGELLWKDVHILNTISASAFILLLANPLSLFEVGFQLTYAATLAIIIFHPRLFRAIPPLPLRVGEMTALSVSALAGVFPIIVRNFNRVTFSSLLLNYAAIPLTGLIMGLGYVYLPVSFTFPAAAAFLARILRALVLVFVRISRLTGPFPFLSYRIPTPEAWTVFGYYVCLGLLLLPRRFKGQRPAIFGGLAVFSLILVLHPFPCRSGDLKVTMIDVGQGDAFLVEFPGRAKMLVDGGGFPESPFDVGERVVSPFLWEKGIKRIDFLVLTHPHPDHLGGLVAVAANFRISEFWEAFPGDGIPGYESLQENLGKRTRRKKVFRGFREWIGGVLVEALHPHGGEIPADAGNDQSLVLRISLGQVSFLLASDVGGEAERTIAEQAVGLQSTVLKSPHHGSPTSSSELFLERARPDIVLISVGEGNLYGFPSAEVLERYARAGAMVFRTDRDGLVELATDGRSIRVRSPSGFPDSFFSPRLTPPEK